jgi:hypothetical protein
VADQHRIAAIRVQATVGLDDELVAGDRCTIGERERLVEVQGLRRDDSDRSWTGFQRHSNKKPEGRGAGSGHKTSA